MLQSWEMQAQELLRGINPQLFQSLLESGRLEKYTRMKAKKAQEYVRARTAELTKLTGNPAMAEQSAIEEARRYILKPFPPPNQRPEDRVHL